MVTDVGGNLMQILEQRNIPWYPMLRCNKRNTHPLWFGVYEDLVYHHGAGFRAPWCRADHNAGVPKEEMIARNSALSRGIF